MLVTDQWGVLAVLSFLNDREGLGLFFNLENSADNLFRSSDNFSRARQSVVFWWEA
jgi:hypothetical protein